MNKTFQIHENEASFSLIYNPDGHCFTPQIDGKTYHPDCHKLGPSLWSVLYKNKSYMVYIQSDHPDYTVNIDNNSFDIKIQNDIDLLLDKLGMKNSTAQSEIVIKASIPGLVKKIEVSEGDKVIKGQGLLILEAMKMENEIKSPSEGIIKVIHVSEGQTLEKNTKMMEINQE